MASTQDVLNHHLSCFAEGKLDDLLSDYDASSVLFTMDGALKGPNEIRPLFDEFAKPGASFDMKTQLVDGEAAYIVWSAETADNTYEVATDTFVVREGKIAYQSLAAKITPKH